MTVLAIFDRLSEHAAWPHVNPSDHYLTFGAGEDVFNSEYVSRLLLAQQDKDERQSQISAYAGDWASGRNNFEIHAMRPYRHRLQEIDGQSTLRDLEG